MTLNLNAEITNEIKTGTVTGDITPLTDLGAIAPRFAWTALQTEICMNVALAKRDAFIAEAERAAEYVRLGFLTRATAADYLHEAALYNQLYFEYGADHVQAIMAAEIGVSAPTVGKARATVNDFTVDNEVRIGLDGKERRLPKPSEAAA